MTVAALSPEVTYLGDGATVAFAAKFRFLTDTLTVDLITATGAVTRQVKDVDYAVTGGATDTGGTVTMNAAPAVGTRLRIRRVTARTQETDYEPNDRFPAETHEEAVDRMMLIDQEQDVEIADTAARAPLVPDGEVIGELPALADRRSRVGGYDGNGEPVAGPLLADIATALAALVNPGNAQAAANVLYTALAAGAAANSLEARARAQEIVPGDFLIDSTGGTTCHDAWAAMIAASADVRLPIQANGRFLWQGPVTMRSNASIRGNADFLIDHTGNALVSPPGQTVGRVTLGGDLRFLAQQTVPIGIDANQWQYCNLNGLRFMTDGAYFTQAIKFSNVSYWSNVRDCELEGVINGIDLSDANNLGLENVNMVKYGDIGQKTFLTVSGPVSMVTGRKLSVEGVFKNTTAVLFGANGSEAASQYGFDLEFIRMEGRSGSTNSSAIDFNGAILNRVGVPLAATNWGAAAGTIVNAEGNRIDWDIASGVGIHQMGHGYAQLPERSTSLSGAPNGALARDTSDGLLKFIFGGAVKEIVLSPLTKSLPCNGFSLTGVNGVFGTDGNQLLAATRGDAIAPATGGATIDAQARTAINALISEMIRQGLISA